MNFIPTYKWQYFWAISVPEDGSYYNYDAGWQYWISEEGGSGKLSLDHTGGKEIWIYADYLPDGQMPSVGEVGNIWYAPVRMVYTGR
jgi:hypothetical protein